MNPFVLAIIILSFGIVVSLIIYNILTKKNTRITDDPDDPDDPSSMLVTINNDPLFKLKVTISPNSVQYLSNNHLLKKLKSRIAYIIKTMTKNLGTEVKKHLATVTQTQTNDKVKLDIYNCDPGMRDRSQWEKDSKWEYLTDIPGWTDLKDLNTNDERSFGSATYGLGGTKSKPRTIICLENIVCLKNVKYKQESIFVHEFAHTIREVGLLLGNPELYNALDPLYEIYKEKLGDQCNYTYACQNNGIEMWAEATQTWFGVTTRSDVNQSISTIEEIKQIKNDHASLYDLLNKVYGEGEEGKGGVKICGESFDNCSFCRRQT